jgi:hypothetical protein
VSIRSAVEEFIARKAAKFLQSRVKGLVVGKPTVADPEGMIGGWIYGASWWIIVRNDQVTK